MEEYVAKRKYSIFPFLGLAYVCLLIGILFFHSNFVVERKFTYSILIGIYIILSFLFILSVWKHSQESLNALCMLVIPIIPLYFFYNDNNLILSLPIIGIALLYILNISKNKMRRLHISMLVIYFLIYCIFGSLHMLLSLLSGMVSTTMIDNIPSPDNTHEITIIEHDAGGSGGSVSLLVEKRIDKQSLWGITKRLGDKELEPKLLYYGHWGDRPRVQWVDKENVKINEQIINIYNSEELVIN